MEISSPSFKLYASKNNPDQSPAMFKNLKSPQFTKLSQNEINHQIDFLNNKYENYDDDDGSTNINLLLDHFNNKITLNKIEENKLNPNSCSKEIIEIENLEDYLDGIKSEKVIEQDSELLEFKEIIDLRINTFKTLVRNIDKNEKGGFNEFTKSYNKMGFIEYEDKIILREFAPGALELFLFGDFNNWNRNQFKGKKDDFGFWIVEIPHENGKPRIQHNSKVKINMTFADGKNEDRNPCWIRYLIQNKETLLYDGVYWNPQNSFNFQFKRPSKPKSLRIYEGHVGMSSHEPKVSTYREFADNILPRIKKTGYNTVQLMAIMEHSYYGSFGYHVTNFFAISSRSGNPDDLKYLIDKAHSLGLYVLMDLVHSHASANSLDGINYFDGTDHLFFHSGERGWHELWESRLFDYKNYETLRFLLSNIRWFIEEYNFDGYRFDGITSMLYKNHGIQYSFSNGLKEYFSDNFDLDSGVYLMMANYIVHSIFPDAITIAEDVSGMPTLCRPIEEGGYGFDYRLNMSPPDKWIELLKEQKDEDWSMGGIVHSLTNRRYNEKHIAYSESHDQCIVGDKTIAMWLFDHEIYDKMNIYTKETIRVDRGMSLHKMIRLITITLGGDAYLNFMGNEFGHPEWVDFPRAGNNFSHHHSRRRWDLCDDKNLRYQFLWNFDIEMNKLEDKINWLHSKQQYISLIHEDDKLITFEKGDLLVIFNFHPNKSFDHYRIGTKWSSDHIILFSTDDEYFGGKGHLNYGRSNFFPYKKERWMNRNNYIQLYIPSRVGIILIAEENMKKYDLSDYFGQPIMSRINKN